MSFQKFSSAMYGLMGSILGGIILMIIGLYKDGKLIGDLKSASFILFTFFSLLLAIWLIGSTIKLVKEKKSSGLDAEVFSYGDFYHSSDYTPIATQVYEGGKWEILYPKFSHPAMSLDRYRLKVGLNPFCIFCDTELKESGKPGRYIWDCVDCSYRHKSKKSMQEVRQDVRRIAQRDAGR